MAFTFHNDPAHGWLEVTASDLDLLGFKPADFSKYSYVDHHCGTPHYFLEEDCDATKFIVAWQRHHGRDIVAQERYSDRESFVRRLPRIK